MGWARENPRTRASQGLILGQSKEELSNTETCLVMGQEFSR